MYSAVTILPIGTGDARTKAHDVAFGGSSDQAILKDCNNA